MVLTDIADAIVQVRAPVNGEAHGLRAMASLVPSDRIGLGSSEEDQE